MLEEKGVNFNNVFGLFRLATSTETEKSTPRKKRKTPGKNQRGKRKEAARK